MKERKVWQWLKGIITSKLFLPHKGRLLSPAPYGAQPAQGQLLSLQRAFTYFPELRRRLSWDVILWTGFLTLTVVWAVSPMRHQLDILAPTVMKYARRSHRLWVEILSDQLRKVSVSMVLWNSHLFKELTEDQDLHPLNRLTKGRSECQVMSITTATWPETVWRKHQSITNKHKLLR